LKSITGVRRIPMEIEAVLKIPHRDVPPADKGTNLLLTLSHTPSTNTGFRGERSLGKTFPRIGKRRATLRTCQAKRVLLPSLLGIPSIGSLTGAWLTLKALYEMS
jgi:hypothetical protein